jgi:hypothetical protein
MCGRVCIEGKQWSNGESEMPIKRKSMLIEVKEQILWIGTKAYPLQNIAQVGTEKVPSGRGKALRRYLKAVILLVLLSTFAQIALQHAAAIPIFLIAVLIAIITISLLVTLLRSTYYALIIETAGSSYPLLFSRDGEKLRVIFDNITRAINDPQVKYQSKIDNYDLRGALGVQIGKNNTQRNAF